MNKNFNSSYYNMIYNKREQEWLKKYEEQDKINVYLIICLILSIIVSIYFTHKISLENFKLKQQINQYKIFYNDYSSSKEYNAIQKCKNEDFWKAECIAYELNERK